jgi:hypothetical protein
VISDAIRYVACEEGRDALIASFGDRVEHLGERRRRATRRHALVVPRM